MIAGVLVDKLSLALAAAGFAALLLLVFRQSPRTATVGWLLAIGFVPYWLGVTLKFSFSPGSAIGFIVLASILPLVIDHVSPVDWLFVLFMVLCVVPLAIGAGTLSTAFVAVTEWGVGYLLGRMLPLRVGLDFIYRAVAVVFTAVAVGALAEFATSVNPFVLLSFGNPSYAVWGRLQERSGFLRAEGAFGHSIALGAALALALPMVLASRFAATIRLTMVVLIATASVVTFSRGSIACALVAIVLSLVLLARQVGTRVRSTVALVATVAAIGAGPLVYGVFLNAGDEASDSSAYRMSLGSLVSDIGVLGMSPAAQINANGTLLFANFRSIDSAVVLIGLSYGAFALAVAVAMYAAAVWALGSGRATPPVVAIVAQLPALLSVALITEYAMFFWFCAGLAVTSVLVRTPEPGNLLPASVSDRTLEPDREHVGVRGTRSAAGSAVSTGAGTGSGGHGIDAGEES